VPTVVMLPVCASRTTTATVVRPIAGESFAENWTAAWENYRRDTVSVPDVPPDPAMILVPKPLPTEAAAWLGDTLITAVRSASKIAGRTR
jgi:hypothetical protein